MACPGFSIIIIRRCGSWETNLGRLREKRRITTNEHRRRGGNKGMTAAFDAGRAGKCVDYERLGGRRAKVNKRGKRETKFSLGVREENVHA